MTRIGIILGSTRPGRVGVQIANWIEKEAHAIDGAAFQFVDLADHPLPMFDESKSPLLGEYDNEHTRSWSAVIAAFDGFVFVTPEYNRSVPAALKNAIDFLYHEWRNKPAGIVSYGSQVSGARAAEHLRLIAAGLNMPTVATQLALSLITDFEAFTTFTPTDRHRTVLLQLLSEVISWNDALATLRL